MNKTLIVAIDFDGVIVHEAFPQIGKLMDGAKETIRDLYYAGYKLVLWTCRTNEYKDENGLPGGYLDKAIEYLKNEGMLQYFSAINDNESDKYNCRKIYAHVYIDDRNLEGFQGWDSVRKILL